jgi:polyisoprenoid-binding protein YceI
MPKVTVTLPHDEDADAVVAKVKPAIEKTIQDFQGSDVEINWTGREAAFNFKSMSFTIKGNVTVDAEQVQVEVDLPFAAIIFKDRTEKAITKNLTRALGQ